MKRYLPDSLEFLLEFLPFVYSVIGLFLETFPSFRTTWLEVLGDLARYRAFIDAPDRETWSEVARQWYAEAAKENPTEGRIHYHLASLAPGDPIQQLFNLCKASVCVSPFKHAKEHMERLFAPLCKDWEKIHGSEPSTEVLFAKAHSNLFAQNHDTTSSKDFLFRLQDTDKQEKTEICELGPYIASTNIAALLGYGCSDNELTKSFAEIELTKGSGAIEGPVTEKEMETAQESEALMGARILFHIAQDTSLEQGEQVTVRLNRKEAFERQLQAAYSSRVARATKIFRFEKAQLMETRHNGAQSSGVCRCINQSSSAPYFTFKTLFIVLQWSGGTIDILPFVHVHLAFLWSLGFVPGHFIEVGKVVPWVSLAAFLNQLKQPWMNGPRRDTDRDGDFPDGRCLREDLVIAGQLWSKPYYPENWLDEVDKEAPLHELSSAVLERKERCLWLGHRIATVSLVSSDRGRKY